MPLYTPFLHAILAIITFFIFVVTLCTCVLAYYQLILIFHIALTCDLCMETSLITIHTSFSIHLFKKPSPTSEKSYAQMFKLTWYFSDCHSVIIHYTLTLNFFLITIWWFWHLCLDKIFIFTLFKSIIVYFLWFLCLYNIIRFNTKWIKWPLSWLNDWSRKASVNNNMSLCSKEIGMSIVWSFIAPKIPCISKYH